MGARLVPAILIGWPWLVQMRRVKRCCVTTATVLSAIFTAVPHGMGLGLISREGACHSAVTAY